MRIRVPALAGGLAAAGAGAAVGAAKRFPSAFSSWNRTSYAGTPVSLTEGLAAAAGLGLASAALPAGIRTGAGIAVGAAAAAGAVDDHFEDRFPAKGKGFKGHIGALREGKATSGALKIGLIGAGAGLGALAIPRRGGRLRRAAAWANQSALIAGTANIVNLLDLRPGRALKASAAASIAAGASGPGAAGLRDGIVAVSAVCMRGDLQGKTMLGDLGANAIGAALGYSLALAPGAFARWSCLSGVVALTLASEKLSFSKVIEETPILAWADRLGRR